MNNMRNKILMTLALLLTAVGGAWADEQSESITTSNNDAPGQKFILHLSHTVLSPIMIAALR